jgi:hypothetical protein
MVEVGGATSTVPPFGAGDAGNGHPAPAWKALGSRLRASVAESPDWKRWSQGRKPGARERSIRRVLVTTSRLQKLIRGIFSVRERGARASLEGRE